MTLAAQSLSLFPKSFRPHILGNTGRQFLFRLPYEEARELAGDLFLLAGQLPDTLLFSGGLSGAGSRRVSW